MLSFGLEPFGFALLGSEVLFNGTDALSQQNLWVTDGTSAGTSELSVAHAASVGAGFSRPVVFSSGGSSEVLYASADLNNLGGLWVTDGTTAGTSELSVAGLGPAQGSPGDFIAFGSLFLFEGADANGHFNLWQTHGTTGGTSEISVPGASSLGLFDEQSSDVHIVPFGSEVLFAGNDSSGRNNLWVTDGTLASTSELSATGADATDGLFPRSLTLFGSEVLFSGLDTAQRTGLWVTNGTSAGTSELSVAHSQLFSQGVDNLTVLGTALFVATDVNFNSTLWVTDGTGAGTSELSVPNSEAFSEGIGGLTVLGSEVLFAGTDADFNTNLWVTHGTAGGTRSFPCPQRGRTPISSRTISLSLAARRCLRATMQASAVRSGLRTGLAREPRSSQSRERPREASFHLVSSRSAARCCSAATMPITTGSCGSRTVRRPGPRSFRSLARSRKEPIPAISSCSAAKFCSKATARTEQQISG